MSKGQRDRQGQNGTFVPCCHDLGGQTGTHFYRSVPCPSDNVPPGNSNVMAEIEEAIRECVEERSAIMEYDGGVHRREAETLARIATKAYCYRITDKPDNVLYVIMANSTLDEARASLIKRFGERLIDVFEAPRRSHD